MRVHAVAFRHKTPGEGVGGFEWDVDPVAARDRIAASGVYGDHNYEVYEQSFEVPFTLDEKDAITDYIDAELWVNG
jgi:hypothetical protein